MWTEHRTSLNNKIINITVKIKFLTLKIYFLHVKEWTIQEIDSQFCFFFFSKFSTNMCLINRISSCQFQRKQIKSNRNEI